MQPIEASPDRWTSHPATIGYGIAVGGVVIAAIVVVAVVRAAVGWWRSRSRVR